MFYVIAVIVLLAVGFIVGLLVGRNNPKIADKASALADSAVAKAQEEVKAVQEKVKS